jgi:hypothetical protein
MLFVVDLIPPAPLLHLDNTTSTYLRARHPPGNVAVKSPNVHTSTSNPCELITEHRHHRSVRTDTLSHKSLCLRATPHNINSPPPVRQQTIRSRTIRITTPPPQPPTHAHRDTRLPLRHRSSVFIHTGRHHPIATTQLSHNTRHHTVTPLALRHNHSQRYRSAAHLARTTAPLVKSAEQWPAPLAASRIPDHHPYNPDSV